MTMKRSPKSKTPTRFQKARFTRPFPDHCWAAQPPRASEEHPIDVLMGDLLFAESVDGLEPVSESVLRAAVRVKNWVRQREGLPLTG